MRIVGEYVERKFYSNPHPLRVDKYSNLNAEDVSYYVGMMVNPDHIKRF